MELVDQTLVAEQDGLRLFQQARAEAAVFRIVLLGENDDGRRFAVRGNEVADVQTVFQGLFFEQRQAGPVVGNALQERPHLEEFFRTLDEIHAGEALHLADLLDRLQFLRDLRDHAQNGGAEKFGAGKGDDEELVVPEGFLDGVVKRDVRVVLHGEVVDVVDGLHKRQHGQERGGHEEGQDEAEQGTAGGRPGDVRDERGPRWHDGSYAADRSFRNG